MRVPVALRANLGLKVLSLSLALLLWFFIQGAKVVEREHSIPIAYADLPDSLMFVDSPPQEMRVLLSGAAQDLWLRLDLLRDVAARVDLSAAHAQLDRAVPSLSDITSPRDERIAVVRILSPSVIPLRLAVRAARELPVRVVFAAAPPGWCLADSPRAEPEILECRGPAEVLKGLEEIATRALDLPDRPGRYTLEAELACDLDGLECAPQSVRVSFETQRLAERTLDSTPLVLVPPAAGGLSAAVDVGEAILTLAGPEPRIEALSVADVGLYIDASRLTPGRHDSVPVIAQFPSWARLVHLEPRAVGVTVQLERPPKRVDADRPRRSFGRSPEVP